MEKAGEEVFERALAVMVDFRRTFGRALDVGSVAELHACALFGLEPSQGANHPGYDALDPTGQRYQIKGRAAKQVDVNNFEFDYLVLVNLDENYRLAGAWRLTCARAREMLVRRPKHRKYQASQSVLKRAAERVR